MTNTERFISPEPPLSGYQAELILIFMEECAEAAHRASKLSRFGIDETQPGQTLTNRQRLSIEYGQIIAIASLLSQEDMISELVVQHAVDEKKEKLRKYMQHSKED